MVSTSHTAHASAWDRVAACESGGKWSTPMRNGSSGGLQITNTAWRTYGGLKFAPRANQASRAQQISVAERILHAHGPRSWSTCAVKARLH
ncbi:transglycosylase family protein [Streptomyces sp. NPDC059985]|uniref:transglycosylase family protein n=1 Tax=Streptomyces sp. NPDC059985 TaxID=3347025 RepID=UPI0036CF10D3